jgi:hypothetical protein
MVQIKAAPLSFWVTVGSGFYLLAALLVAEATTEEAGSFGMAFLIALVGVALLTVAYLIPIALVAGFIGWFIYSIIKESLPSREERIERRRADRAAREAGLPTQRQVKRRREREKRLERARRQSR